MSKTIIVGSIFYESDDIALSDMLPFLPQQVEATASISDKPHWSYLSCDRNLAIHRVGILYHKAEPNGYAYKAHHQSGYPPRPTGGHPVNDILYFF